MADSRVDQLPVASALGGADLVAVEQSGVLSKGTLDQVKEYTGGWLYGEGPPEPAANAGFVITGTPTTGTFTLTFRGDTTDPISFDANPAELLAALGALPSIGVDNLTDGGLGNTLPADGNIFFGFIAALGWQVVEAPTITDGTDGDLVVSVGFAGTTSTPPAVIAQQYLDVLEPAGYELMLDGTWRKVWTPQQIRTGDDALSVDVGLTDGLAITYRAGPDDDDHSTKTQTFESIYWEIEKDEIDRLEVDWTNQRRYETARDGDGNEVAFFAMQFFDTPTVNEPGIALGSNSATSVQFLTGTEDPTADPGKRGLGGSLYARRNGELWIKTGPADTAWSKLAFV